MSRTSLVSRLALLGVSATALPALFACLEHPLKPVEVQRNQEQMSGIAISVNKDVDILFVIDNSGSMAEEQNNLAANFGTMLSVLEAEDVRANYRIGITTTDNGNPNCPAGGAAGQLVLRNCLDHLADFTFIEGEEHQDACENNCQHADIEILPTITRRDSTPKARNWIESTDGETNIGGGISATEAFACFGPQGLKGCGFEAHLESMWKALYRTSTQDSPNEYGFLRENAILSIVFVTDEVDCSYNDAHGSIFSPSNKVFWTSEDDQAPSSAVCWNAGVKCEGGNDTAWGTCDPVNLDEDGNEVDDADAATDAVIRPLSRYISQVAQIESDKKDLNSSQEVLVAAISGVPTTFSEFGEIQYLKSGASATSTTFLEDFGVGPGCTSSVAEAVPPVRLRDFAEAFQVGDAPSLFSVCNEDYGPALQAIADKIRDQIQPACMPACVADSDPSTQNTLEPQCVLTKRTTFEDGNTVDQSIPRCDGDDLPDGEYTCYKALTDPSEMDEKCVEDGYNLEFELVEAIDPDLPPSIGSSISATCQLSQDKEDDCPNLPS